MWRITSSWSWSSMRVKSRSVEKASPGSNEHLAEAGAALEGKFVQNAALGHQLEQVREHDFILSDHDVAQPEFG